MEAQSITKSDPIHLWRPGIRPEDTLPPGVSIGPLTAPPALVPYKPRDVIRSTNDCAPFRICRCAMKLPLNNCPVCWFDYIAWINAICGMALKTPAHV